MKMKKKILTTEKSKVCFGVTNQTIDGYFLPFFDFDHIVSYKHQVLEELQDIQYDFDLSEIYILKSTNGYNAFSLDKLPFNTMCEILNKSINVCKDFVKFGIRRGFLTLRIGNDKELLEIIPNKDYKMKKILYGLSLSHALLFNCFYDFKINTKYGYDGNTRLIFKAYRSEKNGYLEVNKW